MTVLRNVFMSCSGVTGLKEITFNESMGQASATAEVIATAHTLQIGDAATVQIGYDVPASTRTVINNGRVKEIITRRPEKDHVIRIHDLLDLAVMYFFASDNPLIPFVANNIEASILVKNILSQAGITSYSGEVTSFTFGVPKPVPIQVVGAWTTIENINLITSFITYHDSTSGSVIFSSRKPYITGSDTVSSYDFNVGDTGDIMRIEYAKSDDKLINRVVVYGAPGVNASASAASAFLPAGFFKTLVVAHELIDTGAAAGATASGNLTMFNRLTETMNLRTRGVTSVKGRDIVTVTEPFTGLTTATKWLVYGGQHVVNRQGYEMTLTLVK